MDLPPPNHAPLKELLLQDLQHIFQKALENNNLSVALRCKETMARLQGFLPRGAGASSPAPGLPGRAWLSSLSWEELQHLLQELEANPGPDKKQDKL